MTRLRLLDHRSGSHGEPPDYAAGSGRSATRRGEGGPSTLAEVQARLIACERCSRLRVYCQRVAREKRRAYRNDAYWGLPVPGFGDPAASVLILGLAPAAHGANRTGRVFTGDGAGGSGDFLMAALHRAGFANISTSQHIDDGLVLREAYIAAAVRCAPPDNKPLPDEVAACLPHLEHEIRLLPRLRVVVALGQVAWNAWLQLVARSGVTVRPKPTFGHGAIARLPGSDLVLIGCYHPSRQNTSTRKVTPEMYDAVFTGIVQRELRRLGGSRA
jgi:uracil-DNA glycosylase family 4